MDSEMNKIDQLSVESSATFTSDCHPEDQLSGEDNLTIAQHYIELASTLSEGVPLIAPALQKAVSPVVGQASIGTKSIQTLVRIVPATASLTISPQEIEGMRLAITAVTDRYHDTLMGYFAEPLRQVRMTFNTTLAFHIGLIIIGTAIAVIGVLVALMHNIFVGGSIGLAGFVLDAIGIMRAFNKEINDRLAPHFKELLIITHFRTANEYIEKINNPEIKDKALVDLINEIKELIRHLR